MFRFFYSVVFVFILAQGTAFSQTDSTLHNIEITIKNFPASKALLCYYYGSQTFLLDSAVVDTSVGFMHFRSRTKLPNGIYFIAAKESRLLDFIIAGEKNIVIKTSVKNLYDSAFVESKENSIFFDYMRLTNKTTLEVEQVNSMTELLKRATKDKSVLAEQDLKIRLLYKNLDSTTRALFAADSTAYTSRLIKLHQPIEIPETVLATQQSAAIGFFYRRHFWDNYDFSDPNYLHAPFFTTKVDEYLQNAIPKNPDSLNVYMDILLSRAKASREFYQYTLRYITKLCDDNLKGIYSENMFVHLVDAYHHDTISGTDKYVLERLAYKADAFRPNLIGKQAPFFSLPDSTGINRSLEEISSDYTLLVFYSAQCTHCQTQMPQFREALQFTDPNKIKTFFVCTDGIRDTWLPFVRDNKLEGINVLDKETGSDVQKKYAAFNLPVAYLLDKQKKIAAKYLTPESFKKILQQIHAK